MNKQEIILKKVRVNNLKDIDLNLSHGQLIVITGPSGSGKSSLAFDTIYAEGKRRFIQSLSHGAKRFLKELPKPDAEKILGLSPTIAIEQKSVIPNPRSTVGTITSIYDYLRVLYAKVATPYCPVSNEPVEPQNKEKIFEAVKSLKECSITILAPLAQKKKGSFREEFKDLLKEGFSKVRVDRKIFDLSEIKELDEKKFHDIEIVIDRLTISEENENRLMDSLTIGLEKGSGLITILDLKSNEEKLFSEHAYSAKSGLFYRTLTPTDFSFNSPLGMCEKCQGLGEVYEFDLSKIIDPRISIPEGCCKIAPHFQTVKYGNIYSNLSRIYNFDLKLPWEKLPQKAKDVFLYGTKEKWTLMHFSHPRKKRGWKMYVEWRGVIDEAHQRLNKAQSEEYKEKLKSLMSQSLCPACLGSRLKPYPSNAKLSDKKIHEITKMTIDESYDFFKNLKLKDKSAEIAEEPIFEICQGLGFLKEIGLGYLTLERTAPSLSGGESQRVRIAAHLGCGLAGTTYILDEPSIGLHPSDHDKLLQSLFFLRDKKNTIIVVEHDRDTIESADTIVDMGPGSGRFGGEIIAVGNLKKIKQCPNSLTGKYLSGRLEIKIPRKRRKNFLHFLTIEKAQHNNLKSIDVKIPLNGFICITGVSGSGKSSLLSDLLYPALSNTLSGTSLPVGKHKKITGIENIGKVIFIDQSPIGRTPRSNPATYIKMFDEIRELFAMTPLAKAKGFGIGHFSFNVQEGSCPYCHGLGETKVDLDFLEDAFITCPQCKGKRYDEEVLSIKFKGKSILDILDMDIDDLQLLFEKFPKISSKLDLLKRVGLDYLHLGQPSTTLSGGEAQRIKLAKELLRPSREKTLYILDEPTTGLHFSEIDKLLAILHTLVDNGNTVLVIEHNMDFVKSADWIIDLGPKAGKEGGLITGEGSPEQIAKLSTSTGIALKKTLKREATIPAAKNMLLPAKKNIVIEGACEHNLKNLNLKISYGDLVCFTGPSGSGKSSLAFDTIKAEGERRYIETLPPYLRSFFKQPQKPAIQKIEGLLPVIAIDQKGHGVNPRSTVGTITEIYDLLRIIYAHLGVAYCPETNEKITQISKEFVKDKLMICKGKKVQILSPAVPFKNESFEEFLQRLNREGFLRIRLNKAYYEIDESIPFDSRIKNEICVVVDRFIIKEGIESRLLEALQLAADLSSGKIIAAFEEEDLFFNLSFAAEKSLISYPPLTFQSFSFNSEQGMCLHCQGLGFVYGANLISEKKFMERTPYDIFSSLLKKNRTTAAIELLKTTFQKRSIDFYKPLFSLSKEALDYLLYGDKETSSLLSYRGLLKPLEKLAKAGRILFKKALFPLMQEHICPYCKGSRLNPLSSNVRLDGLTITELCQNNIEANLIFFENLKNDKPFLKEPLLEIRSLLKFLIKLGVGYLSLSRLAPSLSGGELQRIRLAKQLGSGLLFCLYILDEPTQGLHPHNTNLLINALKELKDLGNTIIVVEHDPTIIKQADYIFDFGPKGGRAGGKLIFEGTYQKLCKDNHSSTGLYLSKRKKIQITQTRRKPQGFIEIKNAKLHNLKNISASIPLKTITAISGVSGSGKSTLLKGILKEAVEHAVREKKESIVFPFGSVHGLDKIEKCIFLEQSFSTQTARSDISTFTDIMPILRQFFASLKLAQISGLKPSHFSFNHRKGMCKECQGLGYKLIDLQYLPAVKVECEACHGFKLSQRALTVKYKGLHLGQILKMNIEDAKELFASFPKIKKKLDILISIGVGYLSLGQEMATLSGGEAQRIRLGKELSKRASNKTLYIFDEPTIGLHYEDIEKLLSILHRLADKGHTIVVIEHNLDFLANCDYIIDMGPQAGNAGGLIVASGTPEELKDNPLSLTGRYLKDLFSKD